MLKNLHIENYALIQYMQISFSEGLVAITGETGAGKSIILGALGLLLGERANTSVLKNNEKKCVIEGCFHLRKYCLQQVFDELDLDYENETIIRREITATGKSRAFVNDTPVTQASLKELSKYLIDIHSQHKNMNLIDESFQFGFIDSFAENKKLLLDYQLQLEAYRLLEKKYVQMKNEQSQQNVDLDYWQHQLDELLEVQLKEDEQEQLEQESKMLESLSDIQSVLREATAFFYSENSPIEQIRTLSQNFSKLGDAHKPLNVFSERLEGAYIELQDVAKEIYSEGEAMMESRAEERLNFVSQRLNALYSLQHKHGKSSNRELLELQEELQNKLARIENYDEELQKVCNEVNKSKAEVEKQANLLHESRMKVIPGLSKEMSEILKTLGMPHAQIEVELTPLDEFRKFGKEQIRILFSANKNISPDDLSRIASGGERSRLMLTIKYMNAMQSTLPTIIFDEIDTGVSGEISDKMGEMMARMSKKMQVISITHQPQIASKSDQHWEVYKDNTKEKTNTEINLLDKEGRIRALAQMLSGSRITEEALANAKVLLED